MSYQSSLSYSLYYKDYTCSVRGSSCVVCQSRRRAKREGKKTTAGHHFHWQLVNKLKKRDAGTIFLPLFLLSRSFPPPLLLPTTGAFPKNLLGSDGLFRCWNWWKGYITQEWCTAKIFSSVSLHTSIHFSSCSPLLLFFNRLKVSLGWNVVRVR